MWWSTWMLIVAMASLSASSDILMITMGGTKSHKIPFWELARGLIARNHSVTFMSAFPADFHMQGLEEITPAGLVFYVRNFTNWDLVGARMKGEEPVSVYDIVRYPTEACEAFLDDHETKDFMDSKRRYDLMIIDGAFPECAYGLVYHFKIPYMLINTVAFYPFSLSRAGSPTPHSVTPFLGKPLTDNMNIIERTFNTICYTLLEALHYYTIHVQLREVLFKHMGPDMPHPYEMTKNVSFILQNGHHTVTYPRPYLPNVAEIACIHCKPPKPLKKELEDFINQGGDTGFIFVSMGSSVKTSNMPERLRKLLVRTFANLPYQVLWKWEEDSREMNDLPPNVMLSKWLPQQDLLGHKKIKAFVTHGGLLSMFETVYHGVPVVTMPVFCDHDSNAAKAEVDGYAFKLDLLDLTSKRLLNAINRVIRDPKYKESVKHRQMLLKDQKDMPLDTAVYWVEYVMRHHGAEHLLSPARHLNFMQYYSVDSYVIIFISLILFISLQIWLAKSALRYFVEYVTMPRKVKGD
ncbi:UDP-glycosyltransferase family 50 member B3 [Arctopsyche grandis]|uniref:UDP-glycosyltransferase family 50 member B3 n=1 Tax=Arctopsyche grandis TaxID=121162 RepID=UPI00406D7493